MMLLSQAAHALHAHIEGADVRFTAVSTDTRTIQPGDLFIALKGENFDGANSWHKPPKRVRSQR